ncbi:perforin-1-like [Halichoeres trimaculatus]|uniref:perforin-1-like n=1 Tax=Halichoeres trimaculatus TaxID=147232 RepID=UPI003D9DBE19
MYASFVPGYNLVGQGFDVVTWQRKGAYIVDVGTYLTPQGTCTLCRNPLQGNRLQKLPVSAVDWRWYSGCRTYLYRSLHTSISSLIQSYTNQDAYNWKSGLDLGKNGSLEFGGTRSSVYGFATARSREDRYTFSNHMTFCIHYGHRLSSKPPLSSGFLKDVQKLPLTYNSSTKAQYRRLIGLYGTHYISQAYLGGKFRRVTATRTCLSRLNGLTVNQAHSCLTTGINAGLGNIKLSSNQKTCSKVLWNQSAFASRRTRLHTYFTEVIGGRRWNGWLSYYNSRSYKYWLNTLKDHPGIVRHSLQPMYKLVPHWAQALAMKAAIEDYLKENAIRSLARQPFCLSQPNLDNNCCPLQAWRGTLVVTIVKAWNLKRDFWGTTNSFAQLRYGGIYRRTQIIKSENPNWNTQYHLGKVDTRLSLRIEVWDKDGTYRPLGSCVRYLSPGTRWLTCPAKRGGVLIQYTLTCDRHLTGSRCHHYEPSL